MTSPRWRLAPTALAVLFLLSGCASTVDRMVDRAGDVAGRAVDRQVDRRTDRAVNGAIDGMFDAGERAVRCVFTDEACIRRAQGNGDPVVLTDADGQPVDRNGDPVTESNAEDAVIRAPGSGNAPGSGVSSNYDFVPGERVLFFADFENDRVGNFPNGITFVKGTAEVVEWQGNKMYRAEGTSFVTIPLPETLPERFTIEFDLYRANTGNTACNNGIHLAFEELDPDDYLGYGDNKPGATVSMADCTSGIRDYRDGPSSTITTGNDAVVGTGVTPIRVAVDGSYMKVYINERRVANLPNADIQRGNALYMTTSGYEGQYIYLDNLRIAAGGREILYEQLMADGRATLGGLLFDTGSAQIQSGSTAVLQGLKQALDQNAGLRLRVEGHTDNTGSADANERLSQQRAQAVVAWLTQNGVASSRLEAVGMGQTSPVADNGTPAGRQTNRRVEVVRL